MLSEWEEIRLGDVLALITKGTTPPRGKGFVDSGINFIKSESISYDGQIDKSKFCQIDIETHEKFKRSQIQEKDILFSMAGAFLGKNAVVAQEHLPANTNQALAILRIDQQLAIPKFISFCLRNPIMVSYVNSMSAQSAQPNINFQEISSLPVKLPPLPEQKAIAHILGSLDDKIELNRKMNETLEAMAQAMFKSWFVDFDPVIDNALAAGNTIPEELAEHAEQRKALGDKRKKLPPEIKKLFPSEFIFTDKMGWIPKGWEAKTVGDLVDTVSKTYPLKSVSKVIFLNTGDIKEGKFLHNLKSDASSLPGQAKKSIQKGDILYSEIRPQNKRFAFVHFDSSEYVVSTKLMVLRSKGEVDSLFTYFILKQQDKIDYLQMMAESRSGTFPQITFDVLSKIQIVMPEASILNDFIELLLRPIFEKSLSKDKENETLSKLRDTLLPKLLSGELRIKDAEKLVEEVG